MARNLKTQKQIEEEKEREEQKRELKRINRQIEKQDLLRILENQIQTELKEIDNHILIFDTYIKHKLINYTILQYEFKKVFIIENKRYYKNYLYSKYETIANKQLRYFDKLKENKGITAEQMIRRDKENRHFFIKNKPKIKIGAMTKLLTAIFFRIK